MLSCWESCPWELKPECPLGVFRCPGWTLEVGICRSIPLGSGVMWHLACDPSVWVFWEVGQEGRGSTLGDQGCSGISPGISLGGGVGKLWPWSNPIQGRAFPGAAKGPCPDTVLVSLGCALSKCPVSPGLLGFGDGWAEPNKPQKESGSSVVQPGAPRRFPHWEGRMAAVLLWLGAEQWHLGMKVPPLVWGWEVVGATGQHVQLSPVV